MHKSWRVIYNQDRLKSYKKWKFCKNYKNIIYNFKQYDRVRFPRRVARWRAMILTCGRRSETWKM